MSTPSLERTGAKVGQLELGSRRALKRRARQLAEGQLQVALSQVDRQSLDRLDNERMMLRRAYTFFTQQAQNAHLAGQVGEWVLDNYYVISGALRQIEQDMPRHYYRQLPRLRVGEWLGYPRIYLIARELLNGQSARVEMDQVQQFIAYYQETTALTMGELWALPTMLRYNLIERLLQALDPVTRAITSSTELSGRAVSQAAEASIPWSILGLRALDTEDWKGFFEEVCLVDKIFAREPAGVYQLLDFETRDAYRKVVERLSRATSREEKIVAEIAVALARHGKPVQEKSKSTYAAHVGYYLVGDGLAHLEESLAYRPPWLTRCRRWWFQKHPTLLYLGCVSLLALWLYALLFAYLQRIALSLPEIVACCLLLAVPFLTISVSFSSWLMMLLTRPRVLPKLCFDDGVPSCYRTMVVMPTLLTDGAEVDSLLQQIELHYLRNKDPCITFALLTDFCDAPQQQLPQDSFLLAQVSQGIQQLNQRYGKSPQEGPFYLFHRERLWNADEGHWMGWERKRGKLEEFNLLLLGQGETSYKIQLGYLEILPEIRYIITLDADTTLPHGQARRLIGTMAHPLNQAHCDSERGIVTSGYTVLQPRVEVKPLSANYSSFSRIYSGHTGLDLYSLAVSDMYQDLFGEGIYMGKGIYEVETFSRCLAERVPENTLLSHDLFEGLHGRSGMVSDVIVYEEYPPSYHTYVRRAHRWIRGDWQLLPWLLPWVPHAIDGKTRNRLKLIDRWKIIDNLRRSLLRPALMLLLIAGWLWLPGSPIMWSVLVAATLASDLLTSLIDGLLHKIGGGNQFDAVKRVKQPFYRWLLGLVTLPHEAMTAVDAIATVMTRMLFTRRKLLQWTTAAHTVRLLGREQSLSVAWRDMWTASLLSLGLAILVGLLNPIALLEASPFLLAWVAGPLIMRWLSRPRVLAQEVVSMEERRLLSCLARRTWYFFESFVGPEDHWLAPDHFQEFPRGLVAHRTSPTNIGLMLLSTLAAHDFGYLGLPELLVRLQNTLESLDQLERFRGHFLNWYDTSTLAPLPPRYISVVDSGNLACCLVALRQGCLAIPDLLLPRPEMRQGFLDTVGVLRDILTPLAATAPESVGVFQDSLDSIVAKLETAGSDLGHWSQLLTELKEVDWPQVDQALVSLVTEGKLEPTTLRGVRAWSDRVHHQLFDLQRKMLMMMPWLTFMPDGKRLMQPFLVDPRVSATWQALVDLFPADRSACKQIPFICHEAQGRLATLADVLAVWPVAPSLVEDVLRWREQFDRSLADAELEVTHLLSSFADICSQLEQLVDEMDFAFLYSRERGVFHIGYNVDNEMRDANYYDLLASEARMASLLAIAKGDVPEKHWLQLGRPLTQATEGVALLSWSGTMFEYLMPCLLARQHPETLLHQSMYSCIDQQVKYGRQRGVPWGISESGYYRFDASMNYQYRAFGVPGLGFKRGLEDDLVVTPYASILALPFRPKEVLDNIARLKKLAMIGEYGFYEAVDFTQTRLPMGQRQAIVRSFMIHHQGMILLALANTLLDQLMVRRFHGDAQVRSVELLLQERLPVKAPVASVSEQDATLALTVQPESPVVAWTVPVNSAHPLVHYLSNGRYGVLITNAGAGFSRWQQSDLTRWRADSVRDHWGTWVYVHDREGGQIWSAAPQPTNRPGCRWEVSFAPHRVDFHCTASRLSTVLSITVPPDDDVEIRRVRLTNHGNRTRRLALTSYSELVMGDQSGDRRHPAFNKLFIESEYDAESGALIFRRRQRAAGDAPLYFAHAAVTGSSATRVHAFESAREAFLGRGGTCEKPAGLSQGKDGLRGTSGAILDPIMCLQISLDIEAHGTAEVTFLTMAGDSRQQLLDLVERYRRAGQVASAFRQSRARSEIEMQQLNLNSQELEQYQQLLSLLFYPHARLRASPQELANNHLGQSALWPYAISGDLPILMVSLATDEELGLLSELLQAHRYWRQRGLQIDLVVLNQQGSSYDQSLHDQMYRILRNTQSDHWLDRRGGIFMVQADRLSPADRALFAASARVALTGELGDLARQLAEPARPATRLPKFVPPRIVRPSEATPPLARPEPLLFDNGWGGFSSDGREYLIYLRPGEFTPAPWVNVISNPAFGFLVSETGSSFTWALNSGENRLTPWHNDPLLDPSGESLYLQDEASGALWSPTPQPRPAEEPYLVRHGAGYTIFEHNSHGLKQRLRLFADTEAPVKLVSLRLENCWSRPRVLALTYYCEWVLGLDREQTQQYLIPEYEKESGALFATQPFQEEWQGRVAFLASSQIPDGLTADRAEFIGRLGSPHMPEALRRVGLSGQVVAGSDPCAALHLFVDLEVGETKEIHFLLGQGADRSEALSIVRRFREEAAVEEAWQAVQEHWERVLGTIQVETPDRQMDLMLNRWLLYQNLSCRIWGRSGFYQSSGAYGFRDQLQDVLATIHAAPEVTREHILRAAGRQFEAGDVLHWWHPPSGRGVRSRISDDLLWLPYVTAEYLSSTHDEAILGESIPFLKAPELADEEVERYGHYETGSEPASLYEHCRRAIERTQRNGKHGLPLMGGGDWNDGMNRVGIAGRGESIWLGWFIYATLARFVPICKQLGDEARAERYQQRMSELRLALEDHGWDGEWYLRAYCDDGRPLGSAHSEECRISSIAQSWAVLSGASGGQRAQQALNALWRYLVRPQEQLALLFEPPFNNTSQDPGYIKGYPPGVRENGGQYTHAATWAGWACTCLGRGSDAQRLFHMLNPVAHADNADAARQYRVEPYVVAADVYGIAPHTGRGGWTWYTGSAGWLYRLGLEAILGVKRLGPALRLEPCIPETWPSFTVVYRMGDAKYRIEVLNPERLNRGVKQVEVDGKLLADGVIPLFDDGKEHRVEVLLGR